MFTKVLRRAWVEGSNRTRKALSLLKPYEPMEHGQHVLDAQYARAEWEYLRSIGELPRFGVVSAYCRLLATKGSLLEVGCGDGILVEQLDRSRFAHVTGVDISSIAVERARALEDERTEFVCADAETFTPDRIFDLVVFNEVLEYFDDPLAVVQRYEDFMKPDGHMVVSMFAAPFTARTRHIWRSLESRYEVLAHAKVATQRDFLWNVKVLRLPRSA
jgi:2-polyprenyl-3-methyl-5-hydroxy-6-metoxy-1,4-benzoquinol methylase